MYLLSEIITHSPGMSKAQKDVCIGSVCAKYLLLWKNDLSAWGVVGAGDGVGKEAHGPHNLTGPSYPVWEI